MSTSARTKRISPPEINDRKGKEPIVSLTAYSAPMASLLDPYADLLIVGDSVGMVLYGEKNTLNVSVDTMIGHGAAVVRGSERPCIVVDMPFGSYQESPEQALRNAVRIMKETGCSAVKIEGGVEMAETVSFLTSRGIPVMGHVGLMPQRVNSLGGYKARGREVEERSKIVADARAIAQAGAFSLVVEGVLDSVGRDVTNSVPVPTIGIGASVECDGQVLVTEDVVGLFNEFTPKFVKRYVNLGVAVRKAAAAYSADVRARRFPKSKHTYQQ